jgi:transposase
LLETESFPTTLPGYAALLEWFGGFGTLDEIGIESTGSYGAGLTRFLQAEGVTVIQVDRPDRKARRVEGKPDTVDAAAVHHRAWRPRDRGRVSPTPREITPDSVVQRDRTGS